MKKNTVRWWVILAMILIVYHVIAFAVPFEKNLVFFLCYLFTMIAIAAQAYVIHIALYQGKGIRSRFYGFPIIRIGVFYLLAQFILGLLFMGLSSFMPVWIPFVLFVILLGAAVTGFVASEAVRDEVERQDVKLEAEVSCMRELQSKMSSMIGLAEESEAKHELEKLAEELRYSDPVSSSILYEIEKELTSCIDSIQKAAADNDEKAVSSLVKKALEILAERNRLCKRNK